MKVVITGSRDWVKYDVIEDRLRELPQDVTIIHGAAKGADRFADEVALKFGYNVEVFLPDWERYGRGAGHRRNSEMLNQEPDLVLAFHRNNSNGTAGTIREARKRGIPVEIFQHFG